MKQYKKRKKKIVFYKNKRILMYSLLGLFLFLGMGYSVLNTELGIFGNVTVKEYVEPTLYNVLRKEAETNGLAKEYTGSHGDSMDSSLSTEKIYHWYATTDAEATQILDKNNVIFAGQCWQMIRTTDTGGVKLIYNGKAVDNKCLNTRENHIGYDSRTSQTLNSNYWYGTDYIYDSTNQVFSIAGTTEQTTWTEANAPGLIGKYTCRSVIENESCAELYLVESYKDASSGYVISLNASSHYSQFGTLQFNANYSSPADVGYMYNTRYTYNSKTMTNTETMLLSTSLSTAYWYADSVTWGTPTANAYNLDNPYQVSSEADFSSLVGKYTFKNTSQTYTSSYPYYIAGVSGTSMYGFLLTITANHDLSDVNYTYTYGDSYRDNGNGTYTILNQDESNPITIHRSDWYTSYSSVNNKYVCKNAVNDTCSELRYIRTTSNKNMSYFEVIKNYKYANNFEYKLDSEDNTYKYFLDDDNSMTVFEWNDTNKTSLNNYHYTCWNEDGKCTTLSYVYYLYDSIDYGTQLYYINLTNGKSIENAVNEMLYNNDVNQINSIIKSGVDAWYKKYIYPYDNYVEDTIFCNDRSQRSADKNGWNPNGGSASVYMNFKEYTATSDLSCANPTDKFSVSNNVARLTYKVGLMSSPEMNILNSNIFHDVYQTGRNYWLGSPDSYNNIAYMNYVSAKDNFQNVSVAGNIGVRPAISLVPGTEYLDGDGTMEKPYFVGEVYNITNNNSMFRVRKKAAPNYEVSITSNDYIVTSFKVNGNLITGDTFTMPAENVTITDIQYMIANYSITNTDSDITVPNTGRYNTTITLESDEYLVTSFKVNGTLVNGNSFVMPAENVTITEITKIHQVIVESEHNPYANNINNVIYYEHTFEGATSLTVELTYQTEGTTRDWIYLYDAVNSSTPVNNKKYGGSTLKTETITVNSNYLKILFRTNASNNDYYGFKAVITPNYS